ncbi:MAG: adenylate kinase [Bacteroidales bacterium]|nr:adenylate kinase [Bacteroidales bacterium]
MFNLILFGPPGSGKGTQSSRIAEKYNLVHISTGDIFRREIRNKSALGLKVQSIIERGELVPDDLLVDILRSALQQAGNLRGFVFDGFPRTIRQAEDLDKLLNETGETVSLVLSLDVDEEEVVTRLLKRAQLEGREDDTEDVIRNRMKVYHSQTHPLIEYYNQQAKFKSLTGVGSIDDIFRDICKVIDRSRS